MPGDITFEYNFSFVERAAVEHYRDGREDMNSSMTAEEVIKRMMSETIRTAVVDYKKFRLPALEGLGEMFLNADPVIQEQILELLGAPTTIP